MQNSHIDNAASKDAIYYVPESSFDRGLPNIPAHIFTEQQQLALSSNVKTGLIALDLSSTLRTPYPATTPNILARYIVVRAGEACEHEFAATGEIYYVARGAGSSQAQSERISWRAGDVFVLPGASHTRHDADQDSLLVCFTNEPELAYAGVHPPKAQQNRVVRAAYYSANTINEKLDLVHHTTAPQQTAGKAVILATSALRDMRTVLPTLTATINTLEPGGDQRPHKHNAVALTLAVESEGIYSMVDREKINWIPFGVMITPPQAEHSHHNRGPRMMKSFVVQDGGLYYQLRNPGFMWT